MPTVIGASTGWYIGLALGIVVVLVAAAIVITIVLLARRIDAQAKTAVAGLEQVREQTDRAGRGGADQRLRGADPALRSRAAEGGGREVIGIALTNHGAWGIALIIGVVAALAVAALLLVLIRTTTSIRSSAHRLLEVAGQVAGNTANIPQLEATAPVLGKIVEEAVVQDGYMNALTDGYAQPAEAAAPAGDGAA